MGSFEVSAMLGGLDDLLKRVIDHSVTASERGGAAIRDQARRNAEGAPGPAYRTGALWKSILADPPVEVGQATWITQIAPHVVYGRIQELGGTIVPKAGNHLSWIGDDGKRLFARRVTLPPRPYLRPALVQSAGRVRQILIDEWGAAVGGE